MRTLLLAALLTLATRSHAQTGYTYAPGQEERFLFQATSLQDKSGNELFGVRTEIRIQSFAFLGGGGVVDDLASVGSKDFPFTVETAKRPGKAAPLLRTFSYPATESDELLLPWRPKVIYAVTAN
jgi:hypothetical protein